MQVLKADLKKEIDDMEADTRFLRADFQFLKADVQFIKADLERQRKYEEDKESNIQLLRADILSVKAELALVIKNGIDKESSIQSQKVDNQYLRDELEKQKKDGVDKDLYIQQLKAEVERQKQQIYELVKPHYCAEAKSNGINEILLPKFSLQPLKVSCDAETQGGRWTIILRRMDGSVNFYRNWTDYKNGFGNLDGEFFLGLDKIHALTAEGRQELLVVLEDFRGVEVFESYDAFAIGNEDQQYVLHTLGEASGTAGDSFSGNRGCKFSTSDNDNDNSSNTCAVSHSSAWWYSTDCGYSYLTGIYKDNTVGKGITWNSFRGFTYSLKRAVMMIRPKD
ncbi:ficolin-1-like [Drosophila innubila]|uniref:ficolin-1-like n=1 Tax=Drosophila innubila TaxID=198719 RepID=UPI00148CB4C8|nr:ficolin-1-like [Drosophila innubila]